MSLHQEALVQQGLPLLPPKNGEATLFHVVTNEHEYAIHLKNGGTPTDDNIPGTEYIDITEYVKRLSTVKK